MEEEIAHLKAKDKALAKLIDEVGHIEHEVIPNMFMALVHSVIGQQISTKAHITVWGAGADNVRAADPGTHGIHSG